MTQNRNVLINLYESERSYEKLKIFRDISVNYLTLINSFKNKLNFGSDLYSLKIDFSWKDSLTDEKMISNSIYFEYYCVFFNLALIYFEMGKSLYFTNDDLKLKEGIKHFQTSAWIADKIKEEYHLFTQANKITPDLSMNYLSLVNKNF